MIGIKKNYFIRVGGKDTQDLLVYIFRNRTPSYNEEGKISEYRYSKKTWSWWVRFRMYKRNFYRNGSRWDKIIIYEQTVLIVYYV